MVGPAAKALDFVHKLAPEQSSSLSASEPASASSSQPAPIDLPPKYFVVLRGNGFSEPKTLRWAVEFKKVFKGRGAPFEVGQEFPSETEARAYLTAAGYGHFAGV